MQNQFAMKTTIVGSFPLDFSNDNIKRIAKDLVEIGIDYVNYPQLVDMHSMFLDPLVELKKVRKDNKLFFIEENFTPPPTIASSITNPVHLTNEVVQTLDMSVSGLRACVTGPFTMMTHMRMDDIKKDPPWNIIEILQKHPNVFENMVTYVNMIAKEFSKHCDIVSIDEPILGLLVGARNTIFDLQLSMSTDDATQMIINTLNQAMEGITAAPSIHICGEIPPLLRNLLLETNTSIVDHEFRTSPNNFDIFERELLESHDKMLAFGAITTMYGGEGEEIFVESVNNIRKWIQKAIDQFGSENLLIKPDCGFGSLKGAFPDDQPYQLVLKKLRNMVEAVKSLGY